MSTNSTFPNYTKLDSHGKEPIYWNGLGACGHIMIFTIQCFVGDWVFCSRCDGPTELEQAKFMRPHVFMSKYGGQLVT
jgi:hypothetical protein